MQQLFERIHFFQENENAEYIDLYLLTLWAAIMYFSYGIVFAMFAYSHLLVINQATGVLICIAAFMVNQRKKPRLASIFMILLLCISANVWAYAVDVGGGMRWWTALTLCPLYFFSSFRSFDKFLLTGMVIFSFSTSVVIAYYHMPLAQMPKAHVFETVSNLVIFLSIAGELMLYKFVETQKENEFKRVETILENIECGIAIIDAQTHEIVDVNRVAARMYGDDKENLLGKKCHAFICPAQEGACPITDKNQTVERSERVLVRINGENLPIVKSVARIWYKDRPALLESFTDISDLKEAEEKLRLMQITERANQAKSEFLSRMSHEIRTPMNAIIGMTKIAEGTDDVKRLRHCLSTIKLSSSHLLGIINDILDMSKIEAGKLELNRAALYIEDIIMKVCKLTIEQVEQKNLKLSVLLDQDTSEQYFGDELRLSQVVANLVSNAVKFTPDGGTIKLRAETIRNGPMASVLRFTVADTGIGMTKKQIDKLFNAFEQADGSITRQFGGTGLGLAISKNIVEKMEGRIWTESEPGKGSTFYFEIRLERAVQIKENDSEKDNIFFGRKLLIVHPDAEVRNYFRSIVEWHGMRADEADSIEAMTVSIKQAMQSQESYDGIFLAYEWPEVNGLEAVAKMDEAIARKQITIMTSFLSWGKIEKPARAAGVNRFISAPLFPSTVLEAIRDLLGKTDKVTEKTPDVKPNFSGITLLLAEDVEVNREIFITLLEDTHLTIEIAENGQEAVQKFKANPERYAGIVMDIQMPEMNGYEATRQIRALDIVRARNIPIIAMTADAFQEDLEKCMACGMNDHLKKPIEMDMVIEKLAHYCLKG